MTRSDYVLHRFSSAGRCTLGMIHHVNFENPEGALQFKCFTLEDESREVKLAGQTRIPAGCYEIKLRDVGGMTRRYHERFDFHQGMLWLQAVPGFEWIYIHPGNTHQHTEGCILVGNGVRENVTRDGFLSESTKAYKRLYLEMLDSIQQGEQVFITIKDIA